MALNILSLHGNGCVVKHMWKPFGSSFWVSFYLIFRVENFLFSHNWLAYSIFEMIWIS
jgi:hypothetical protein